MVLFLDKVNVIIKYVSPLKLYRTDKNVLQMGGAEKLILRPLSAAERSQSSKEFKKYAVDLPNGKTVYFGHTNYEDYTIHKDHERMNNYITRHQKRENWTKMVSAQLVSGPGGYYGTNLHSMTAYMISKRDLMSKSTI